MSVPSCSSPAPSQANEEPSVALQGKKQWENGNESRKILTNGIAAEDRRAYANRNSTVIPLFFLNFFNYHCHSFKKKGEVTVWNLKLSETIAKSYKDYKSYLLAVRSEALSFGFVFLHCAKCLQATKCLEIHVESHMKGHSKGFACSACKLRDNSAGKNRAVFFGCQPISKLRIFFVFR